MGLAKALSSATTRRFKRAPGIFRWINLLVFTRPITVEEGQDKFCMQIFSRVNNKLLNKDFKQPREIEFIWQIWQML